MSRRWRTMLPMALGAALLLPAVPGAPGPARAAADWPPSSDVVVGEVVTGGASGSDEYVELYNGSQLPVELGGLELAYVTASGGTVTSKHRWSERRLGAGEHLLLANADGIFAGLADHTYANGLSATGGSLVLRVVGGGVDRLAVVGNRGLGLRGGHARRGTAGRFIAAAPPWRPGRQRP